MKTMVRTASVNTLDSVFAEIHDTFPEPTLIIYAAESSRFEWLTSKLVMEFPTCHSIGAPGRGLSAQADANDTIFLSVLGADVSVSMGLIPELDERPVASVLSIEENLAKIDANEDNTVCLEFCTGNEEVLVTVLNAVISEFGIALAGGSAYPFIPGAVSRVAMDGQVYENSCVYAFIKNKTGRIRVFREIIHEHFNNRRYHATAVDRRNRRLMELDGRPAAEVYIKAVGIDPTKLKTELFRHPFGRIVGQAIFTTSVQSIDEDGGLSTHKQVNRNDAFYLMRLKDYWRVNRETCERIRLEVPEPSMILTIDCADRYRLFCQDECLDEYIAQPGKIAPHMGIISGGEQYRTQHMNETLIVIVFE